MNRPAVTVPGPALFERERELQTIAEAFDRLESGSGSFLVVEGPAGIGKSRLVTAAGRLARSRGLDVLKARGTELESAFSFGVVRQLFEPALARLYQGDREELFEGSAAAAGRLLFPTQAGQDEQERTSAAPLSLVHSLWWLTSNLARRSPLLVSLDDAHWSDVPSLKFLGYLLQRVEGVPVVVLASVRTGERAPGALQDVTAEPAVTIPLAGLTEAGTREFASFRLDRLVDQAFVDSLHRATRGNPLLLNEMLRTIAEQQIPVDAGGAELLESLELPSVSRTVVARVRRLGPQALAIARAVAVWGGRAELNQAAEVARIDRTEAGRLADRLAEVEVLLTGRPLEFAHPLVYKAVYADIPPSFKAEGHSQAARILRAIDAPVERVAAHLLQTEPAGDETVIDALRLAATAALSRGAPDSAKQYLERALREPPVGDRRGRVLCKLGVAQMRIEPTEAVGNISEALDWAEDNVGRGKISLQLIRAHLANGSMTEAERVIRPVISRISADQPDLAVWVEAELIAAMRQGMAASPLADARLERMAEGATGDTPAERLLLSQVAVKRALTGAGADEVAQLAEAALGGARLLEDQGTESLLTYVPLYPLLCADRFEVVEGYLRQALKDAAQRGSPPAFALASSFRACLGLCRGDLGAAEADARAALDNFRLFGPSATLTGAAEVLVAILTETGALDQADEVLRENGLEGEIPDSVTGRVMLATRGRLRMAQGRNSDALDDLLGLMEREESRARSNLYLSPYLQWTALALVAAGRTGEAESLSRTELAAARTWGSVRGLALSLIQAAKVVGGEEAAVLFEEAVQVTEGSPAKLARAQALVEYGACLRRSGKKSEAVEMLRAGLDLAHRCGAGATAKAAKADLVLLGARPRRHAQSGTDSLTPAERRVAELAEEGLTNRQIAERLFLTTRTVEHHLTSTYQKLGVSSRSELKL